MSLVKKLPPPPSISKVNAYNKELLCFRREWGKAGGHLFQVKSYKGIGSLYQQWIDLGLGSSG